ncbi:MAG: hypothetical protein ACE5HJ_04275 [Thermoplasmata archaeon]
MTTRPPLLVLLVSLLILPLFAFAGGPGHPRYEVEDEGGWMISVNVEEHWVSLTSKDGSRRLLVDGDGPEDDDMYAGLYLTIDGKVLSGSYLGHRAPLIAPERPFVTQTSIHLRAEHDAVEITLVEDGPIPSLEPDAYPLIPPFKVVISLHFGQEIVVRLKGLYYILPMGPRNILLWYEGGEAMEFDSALEGPWQEYFEGLRAMEFLDSMNTRFRIETNAKVVQLEALPPSADPGLQAFEIDFDHSLKEYGQFEILTTLYLSP